MDTGGHTRLFLLFFCVCFTQGLEQNKVDSGIFGEKGQAEQKSEMQQLEEKVKLQEKPETMQLKENGQAQQKSGIDKLQEKVQLQRKPETKQPQENSPRGQVQQKPSIEMLQEKGQEQQQPEMEKLQEKDQAQQKQETPQLQEKGQVQQNPETEKLQEKGPPGEGPSKVEGAISEGKAPAPRHPCREELKIGPCKAAKQRFWFNGKECVAFNWGGCAPNGNNFKRKCDCERKCLGRALRCECYEPKEVGRCRAAIPRWFFDGRVCKEFIWGGCSPNGNNFKTKRQCEEKCGGQAPRHTCVGPRKIGPCQGKIPRWWYDGKLCKKFLWGGCAPNANNYKSKEDCERNCAAPPPNCSDPIKTGPCTAAIPRFGFDGGRCRRFLWGGCAPNGNNFKNKLICEKSCMGQSQPHTCVGPRKIGPCRASIPRWWFNGSDCTEFLWGGCAPNGNNYKTKEECEKMCVAPPPNCHETLKKGPCKGSILRFGFNGKVCKGFLWGGCAPNGNNFKRKVQCEEACIGRKRPRACLEPKKVGPCKAAKPRFWFDGLQCAIFIWGGCAPNGNNFKTELECRRKCIDCCKPRSRNDSVMPTQIAERNQEDEEQKLDL